MAFMVFASWSLFLFIGKVVSFLYIHVSCSGFIAENFITNLKLTQWFIEAKKMFPNCSQLNGLNPNSNYTSIHFIVADVSCKVPKHLELTFYRRKLWTNWTIIQRNKIVTFSHLSFRFTRCHLTLFQKYIFTFLVLQFIHGFLAIFHLWVVTDSCYIRRYSNLLVTFFSETSKIYFFIFAVVKKFFRTLLAVHNKICNAEAEVKWFPSNYYWADPRST